VNRLGIKRESTVQNSSFFDPLSELRLRPDGLFGESRPVPFGIIERLYRVSLVGKSYLCANTSFLVKTQIW
jgi:hypothetical protein